MTPVTNGTISRGRQALRRDVNKHRLSGLGAGSGAEVVEVFCECGRLRCTDRIQIAPAAYERVRTSAACFVVSAGHEETGVEELVARHDGYVVVERTPRR
jgi:hypothetical protein